MTYTAIRVGASATIEDVQFSTGDEAIRIQSGFDITISDCLFSACGIVFESGYQTAIIGNTFSGFFTAITFEGDVDTVQVVANRFQSTSIIEGGNNYIGGLLFADNIGYGGSLNDLAGDYITILDNRFIGGGEINIVGAGFFVNVQGNTLDASINLTGLGDQEDYRAGGQISNNYLEFGSIVVNDYDLLDIFDNTILFPAAGAGIVVAGVSEGVTIKGNRIDDPGASPPSAVGVDIQDATVTNAWVVLNRFGPGLAAAISDSGTNTSTSVSVGSAGDNYDAT